MEELSFGTVVQSVCGRDRYRVFLVTELDDSVKLFEPHLALFGGEDGLDFYRSIAINFSTALKPGGYLCFEFGDDQGDSVCAILEANGYTILERSRDYNDRERAVIAQYGRKED